MDKEYIHGVYLPRTDDLGAVIEGFDDYESRMQCHLPNFPSEVLRDWLYGHGKYAFRLFGWLDYKSFRFHEARWITERIVEEVRGSNEPAIESWKQGLLLTDRRSHRRFPLAKYMLENGTWPVAPVVLDNSDGIADPKGCKLAKYHLLEGHHRIGYLRAMEELDCKNLIAEHRLWLASGARFNPKAVAQCAD